MTDEKKKPFDAYEAAKSGDPYWAARWKEFCQSCTPKAKAAESEPNGTPGEQYLASLNRPATAEDTVHAFALDSKKMQPHMWDGPDRRRYRRNLIARLEQARRDSTGFDCDFDDEERQEFPDLFEAYGL